MEQSVAPECLLQVYKKKKKFRDDGRTMEILRDMNNSESSSLFSSVHPSHPGCGLYTDLRN